MKDQQRSYFLNMLRRYREGIASEEEIELLEAFYNIFDENGGLITEKNEADFLHLKNHIKNAVDQQISLCLREDDKGAIP